MGNSKTLQEAQSMLTQSQPKLKNTLDFLPAELEEKYQNTDLDYNYCVSKFSEMQAAKRDTIPLPTMKIWFIEFVRLGWTKVKFNQQYEALMTLDILGYAIRIDHWINAVKPFVQSYESHKPMKEKRHNKGLGLREYLDELNKKKKGENPFYIDRETGEKVYYPVLPNNWRLDLISRWRLGDRIKQENRNK